MRARQIDTTLRYELLNTTVAKLDASTTCAQIVFDSDVAYLVLMVFFSVSTGYIGTICMMFAPKILPEGQAQVRRLVKNNKQKIG